MANRTTAAADTPPEAQQEGRPPKSLSERLAAKAAQAKKKNHRLSIRAVLPEIEKAIEDGFSLTEAWRDLKEQQQVSCCLATFKSLYRSEHDRAERVRAEVTAGQPAAPAAGARPGAAGASPASRTTAFPTRMATPKRPDEI